ncbi:hypothetical protein LCGC14_0980070 [marine sediment metagenome]|uniref:Uncharacterized protein n=1 Tax=marine sediment metagenome TaxID=412755 RepID=A0A0F9N932_9ZZZZ
MKDITIIITDNSENQSNESEESMPGEDWMYDDDINSGLY